MIPQKIAEKNELQIRRNNNNQLTYIFIMLFGNLDMYLGEFWATIVGIIVGGLAILAIVISYIVSKCMPSTAAISVGGRGATSKDGGTTTFSPLVNDPEDTIPSPETAGVSSF